VEAADGNCEAAVVTAAEAELVWRRARYPFVVHLLFPLLAHCRLVLGDHDEAVRVLDRWADTGVGGHAAWRPLVLAGVGRTDHARALVAERPPLAAGRDDGSDVMLAGAHRLVIAALLARDLDLPDLARRAEPGLRVLRQRGVAYAPGWPAPIAGVLDPETTTPVAGAARRPPQVVAGAEGRS
jgi:hypothetical protein